MNESSKNNALYMLSAYLEYTSLSWYQSISTGGFLIVAMSEKMTKGFHEYLKKENRLHYFDNNQSITCLHCESAFFKNGELCQCYEKLNRPHNYIFSIQEECFPDSDIVFDKVKARVKSKSASANRAILEKEAEGFYTENDLKVIYIIQKGLCYYCMEPIGKIKNKYSIDHIVPLSSGGSNWPLNLALSCRSCNSRKSWCSESWFLKKIRDELSENSRKEHKEYVANIRKLKRKIYKKI